MHLTDELSIVGAQGRIAMAGSENDKGVIVLSCRKQDPPANVSGTLRFVFQRPDPLAVVAGRQGKLADERLME